MLTRGTGITRVTPIPLWVFVVNLQLSIGVGIALAWGVIPRIAGIVALLSAYAWMYLAWKQRKHIASMQHTIAVQRQSILSYQGIVRHMKNFRGHMNG